MNHRRGDAEAAGRRRIRGRDPDQELRLVGQTGFTPQRTQWTIDNSVANGDIDAAKKPSVEQVANIKLADEAVELAGGRVTIGKCTE